MVFSEFVDLVKDLPVFETGLLLSGDVNAGYLRKQISLWVNSNKITQLRRGLYVLAPPFQKVKPHPFLIANYLQTASYVSYQSALAYYGLIPEFVAATISATTRRPGKWQTSLGSFEYHHTQQEWFDDYVYQKVTENQSAYIATPEKALLDLILLMPQGNSSAYLDELRLQNLETLDLSRLEAIVEKSGKPKLTRFFSQFKSLVGHLDKEYQVL